MQRLSVVNPNGHTDVEILAALQGVSGSRRWSYRYELLTDGDNRYLRDLDNVISCRITHNWLADIKRVATFELREVSYIDYLLHRIRPYARLYLSPYGEKDYVEWALGTFILNSPERHASRSAVTRTVEAFDKLQIYNEDSVELRRTFAAGANVITSIQTLIGALQFTPSTATFTTAKEWDPGTTKLRIINDCLAYINYNSLYFDVYGYSQARPYVLPTNRPVEYVYDSSSRGLIIPDVSETFDLTGIPNRWTLVVSEPDRPVLTSIRTNTDPSSPTSLVRRGRYIDDFRFESDAANQAALDAKCERLRFEASQVYHTIEFDTAFMPIHDGNDVYQIRYPQLAIDAKFVEQSWSYELKAGARMKHTARRVVQI